jgi:uncharacterized damage-inducible protein DinB
MHQPEEELCTCGVMLLHAAHHATEHRQQIATMLTNLAIQPPEPDLMAYWESIQSG